MIQVDFHWDKIVYSEFQFYKFHMKKIMNLPFCAWFYS